MYKTIIIVACLASVVILSIVLTTYVISIKRDFDDKMQNIVEQLNKSNYYQNENDKMAFDKLKTLDEVVYANKSNYMQKTNNMHLNSLNANSINVDSELEFDNVKLNPDFNNLNVNLKNGSSMNIKNNSGQNIMNLGQNAAKVDKLQIGDKYLYTKDDWLLFNGNGLQTDSAQINKSLSIKGAISEHNDGLKQTQFSAKDNKNYIRGDTNIYGNTYNVGDMTIGRDLSVENNLHTDSLSANSIRLGDTTHHDSPFAIYSDGMGAVFQSEYTSYINHMDGNTYLRPGKRYGSVMIGDKGDTTNIILGDPNTTTLIGGKVCIDNSCLTKDDLLKLKIIAENDILLLQNQLKNNIDIQNSIQQLSDQKATEQIVDYKKQVEIREKSIQEQIDELVTVVNNIKNKLSL